MGWSFRRRIKAGPLNVNFSKSGVGLSAGAGPLRVGVDARGRHYTNVRGPFGLYNRQYQRLSPGPDQSPSGAAATVAWNATLLLAFAALCVAVWVQSSQTGWLVVALVTALPAVVALVGFLRHTSVGSDWYKAAISIVRLEKWLLIGILVAAVIATFTFLTAMLSGGRRRRR